MNEDEIGISGPDYARSRSDEMPKAYINTGKNSKLERERVGNRGRSEEEESSLLYLCTVIWHDMDM